MVLSTLHFLIHGNSSHWAIHEIHLFLFTIKSMMLGSSSGSQPQHKQRPNMEHSQHQRDGTGDFLPRSGHQQRPNPSTHTHSSSLPNLESNGHQNHTLDTQGCPPCCSSRDAFRQLTRDILHLTVQSTKEAGIPVNSLDPKKYNPSEAMEVPLAYDR